MYILGKRSLQYIRSIDCSHRTNEMESYYFTTSESGKRGRGFRRGNTRAKTKNKDKEKRKIKRGKHFINIFILP